MSYHFRCCACRGRNVLPRHWQEYKRPRRCTHCPAVDRFYLDKERTYRKECHCRGAYHWPGGHRRGSPMCEHHPFVEANRARRQGADDNVVDQLHREATMKQQQRSQPGLPGIQHVTPVASMHIAVLGSLARPAFIVENQDELSLDIWIRQPGSALPICACLYAARGNPAEIGLRERELRLQRIGDTVMARGQGLGLAVIDGRECLRIGLVAEVDLAQPLTRETHERVAA